MPNWCEGSLKVRGTKENMTKFILEGLHPVGFLGEEHPKLSVNEYGDIDSNETCWIENTRRGFVEGVEVYFLNIKMMKSLLQSLILNLHGEFQQMNF